MDTTFPVSITGHSDSEPLSAALNQNQSPIMKATVPLITLKQHQCSHNTGELKQKNESIAIQ